MSIRDKNRTKDFKYDASRDIVLSVMVRDKASECHQRDADLLFICGFTNLEVCDITGYPYTEVVMLRKSFERRKNI